MPFDDVPHLSLVTPMEAEEIQTVPHPFANPGRTKLIQAGRNIATAIFIVPLMAAAGGVMGICFFALVFGALDYFYFHPEFARPYLENLGYRSLLAGLLAGIPTGAYAATSAASNLARKAGKWIAPISMLIALPFIVVPPFRLFFTVLKFSAPYHLPEGFEGGILIALPFILFVALCNSIFARFADPK